MSQCHLLFEGLSSYSSVDKYCMRVGLVECPQMQIIFMIDGSSFLQVVMPDGNCCKFSTTDHF